MRYKVIGDVRIEYLYRVSKEVEAESEDDAIDAVCDKLSPSDAESFSIDTGVTVTLIEDIEDAEDVRMRRLGAPMLPGLA